MVHYRFAFLRPLERLVVVLFVAGLPVLFAVAPERFGAGTLAPFFLASDSPIAMACLRLVTFLPDLPDRSLPRFRSCIASFTDFCAFLEYFAIQG